jgi:hypothetical protein
MSVAPIRIALTGLVAVLGAGALAGSAQAACPSPAVQITAPATPTVVNDRTSVRGVVAVTATIDSADPLTAAGATVTPQGQPAAPVLGFNETTKSGTLDTMTLPDGPATLEVTAAAGGCPTGTDTVELFIDNTAPTVTITQGPAENEELASASTLTFAWSSSSEYQGEPVPALADQWPRYRCRYDAAPLGPCNPAAPATLGAGNHSFTIEATDRAGNVSSAVRNFRVALPPAPTVPTTPTTPTTVTPSSGPDEPKAKPACRVPRLRGLTLTAARRKLQRANCRLGRVTKPPKSVLRLPFNRGQRLVVQRQSERPGVKKPNGQKVGVALVPRRDLKLS